jgi:hypothetical protein
MKLSKLKDDEGMVFWFQRLIDSKPSQILIFEPDTLPAKRETDVYFYFPCNNKHHEDCGFFCWVLSIKTSGLMLDDIEELRRDRNLTELEVAEILRDEEQWAYGVSVPIEDFNKWDVLKWTSDWIAEWVEELIDIPLVLIDLVEHRRLWAKYEEFHTSPEAVDIYFAGMRDALLDNIESSHTRDEFKTALGKLIDEAIEKKDDDEY